MWLRVGGYVAGAQLAGAQFQWADAGAMASSMPVMVLVTAAGWGESGCRRWAGGAMGGMMVMGMHFQPWLIRGGRVVPVCEILNVVAVALGSENRGWLNVCGLTLWVYGPL